MRKTFVTAAVALLAFAGAAKAAVQMIEGTEFETAGWAGGAVYEADGTTFRACYMLRELGDTDLLFTLDKAGMLSVGLRNEAWSLADDYEATVRFQLDDWVDVEVGAVAVTPHALLIPAGSEPEVVQAFQQGSEISISNEAGTFQATLTGTTKALPALADCVADVPAEPGKQPLTDDEREAVRALALYPPDVREAILETTLHPDIIAELGKIAEGSRKAFRDLVGQLPREDQTLVWEVVRYPAMLDAVKALGASPSEDAVRAAIADQPAKAQEALLQLAAKQPDLVDAAHDIRLQAEQQVDALLSQQPLDVESAFRLVIDHPEALAAMNERPDLVARIAEVYQARHGARAGAPGRSLEADRRRVRGRGPILGAAARSQPGGDAAADRREQGLRRAKQPAAERAGGGRPHDRGRCRQLGHERRRRRDRRHHVGEFRTGAGRDVSRAMSSPIPTIMGRHRATTTTTPTMRRTTTATTSTRSASSSSPAW